MLNSMFCPQSTCHGGISTRHLVVSSVVSLAWPNPSTQALIDWICMYSESAAYLQLISRGGRTHFKHLYS